MHPSAVGAVHDSRGAERGYSGFAHDDQDIRYTDGGHADGEEGWYNLPESGDQGPDYQPQPDNAGYGQVSYPEVYDLGAAGPGGFPSQAGYPGQGYVE
ncbi:MAG TPA: hypothetical protein VGD68_00920, partial [Streptosporangiaceae bacterium]